MLQRIADGRTDLVLDYLEGGHAATSTDANGVPLIRWCVYYGDVSALRLLLSHGESLDSLGANHDLNGAVFHGHWQLCEFLLEHGADANQPLPDTGETPLHAACQGHPRFDLVLEVLLSHGAQANCATRPGVETGNFMRDSRTRGETPLHRAAAFGSGEAIQLLLDAGANLEARDQNGDSPLSWASWYLRPAFILEKLCFGEHSIHPNAVSRSREDRGATTSSRMEIHLLGTPHL